MNNIVEDNISKDFKIGNTRVKIATNFCSTKTPEDVQKILERIAKDAMQSFIASKTKTEQKEQKIT